MYKKNIKKLIIISILVVSCIFSIEPVFAINCDGILTTDAAEFLNKIMSWIRILVPALLIVFGCVDFGGAVISDDKDGLKKAGAKFVKRCLCGVAIFFIPLIVKVLLDISGISGTLVDDPMCGIEEVEV
jgi:hypothetical protein